MLRSSRSRLYVLILLCIALLRLLIMGLLRLPPEEPGLLVWRPDTRVCRIFYTILFLIKYV